MTIVEAIEQRKSARFLPRQWVELEFYDCVTFVASVYCAAGVMDSWTFSLDYAVYGKSEKPFDRMVREIEATDSFDLVEGEPQHGDLLALSRGNRGHHAAIYLDGGRIAHCTREEGVVITHWQEPFVSYLKRIYRPRSNG